MSTYKACRQLCGLSQGDAADFHQVSLNTIQSWDTGRRNIPLGAIRELASLWSQIEDACDAAASVIEQGNLADRDLLDIEADITGNELPTEGSRKAAGAMALLITVAELEK